VIKKLIIMLVVIVCLSSGAFAIFSEYMAPVIDNNTNDTNVNMDSSVGNVKEISFLQSFSDFDDYWQYSYGFVKNVDGELRHYINAYGLYYLESDGLADMYIQCVECGGYIPIGSITNPLPKAAICHYNDAGGVKIGSDYPKKNIYSRDDVYQFWVSEGKPVYDNEHFNPGIYSRPRSEYVHAIFCNDCGGHVILKNYDALKIHDSYLDYILNIWDVSLPVDLCSHYNGSLDLFNASVDDFHPGWFKSIDKYNRWLDKASQDLDNSSNSGEYVYYDPVRDPVVVVVLDEENLTDMSDGYVEEMVDISDENSTVA